ncbi:MAG: tandem-95 repeat protein [Acidimicrobiia bacterium]|nr:tandem-95 repeat protein [Acidimicrobiia bacterium]
MTTRRRYRFLVLMVSVVTLLFVAAPVSAADPAAPVTNPDAYDINKNGVLVVDAPGVLANDFDPNGREFWMNDTGGGPSHGSLTWERDGSIVYTPTADFVGVDTFMYQARNAGLFSDAAQVTITVSNTPPVANDDVFFLDEDTALRVDAPGILGNDSDADGDAFYWALISATPSHGDLVEAYPTGAFYYVPDVDFAGVDTFSYVTFDGMEPSNDGIVTLNVIPVNDPPVAHPDAYEVNEDDLLVVSRPGVLRNDVDIDGPVLEAVLDTGPSFGTLFALNADGSFRYEPDPNYFGADRFSYHATDGLLDSATVVVDINVRPVNDRPIARPDEFATPEDTLLEIAVPGLLGNDSDVESDTLTPVLRAAPDHGTLTEFGTDGSFSYMPDPDFDGTDEFRYRVSDGVLNSNTVAVTINVGPVNDAPIAVADEYHMLEDEILTIPLPGVLINDLDVDGDELTAHLDVGTSDGDLTTFRRNGSFVYEPDEDFNGMDQFGYHASDGTEDSNVVRVKIFVESVNDVPVAVADEYTTGENERLVVGAPGILGNDTDADGDRLWAERVDGPMHGDLTAFARNGSFTYVPDTGFGGTDYFTYHATDDMDDSEIVRVTIIVVPDNEAPVAVADEYDVAKNGELVITAPGVLGNDSDPDGDTLEAVLDTAPIHGTLALNANGSFTYEPDSGYVGVDGFRYHANDGEADSNIVRAVINVHYECNGVIATIVGTNGPDVIFGTSGDDVIVGLKGADEIHGGAGDDLICGDGGFDKLYGDEGNDRLEGWAGNDRLFGGDGDDFLKGEGRSDLLKGGDGEDTLVGGKGFDRLFGNRDNDLLKAKDGGEDKLNGGRGFDTGHIDTGIDIWTSVEKFL